jgi:hypothetical protein
VDSGKAAAAAAPYIAAALSPETLSPMAPGLAEITEGASDDDADIIITTVIHTSPDQALPVLPTPRSSSSTTSSAAAAAAAGYRPTCRGVARASLGVQIKVLSGRAFLWWLRNPAMLWAGEGGG